MEIFLRKLSLLLVGLVMYINSVESVLVAKPQDTEALIGDSTYFDCASNESSNEVIWYHYAVGAKDHEDICLYCLGKIHPQYENRITIQRNISTRNTRLRLKSVQREDAGRYVCQDNGGIGESASAQLVILESRPYCISNMKPDGVLGPNSCGLQPDTLQLSCKILYLGNIPPIIKWRSYESIDSANTSSCHSSGNLITCNLTMTADIRLNGSTYICTTNRSATTQYQCASDIIRIIYAIENNSTKELTEDSVEKVYCAVNSSLSCSHKWKWFDGVYEEVVTYGSPLVVQKPGWHKCEAECIIRGKRCTVLSKLVHVSEKKGYTLPVALAVGGLALLVMELLIGGLIYSCWKKSTKLSQYLKRREETPLLNDRNLRNLGDENQPSSETIGSILITTTNKQLIRGMAILDNKLFVVTRRSQEMEVFDCNTLASKCIWRITKLIRPSDMASCKQNKCLYIMDVKFERTEKKEVLCVKTDGTLLRKWTTGDDYGHLISVTNEANIIIACRGKNQFNEYSPEGELKCKISLQDVEVPTHVIKLVTGDFVVSSGDIHHQLHLVCVVDANGKVKKSFGREKGSDADHMDHPLHLAVLGDATVVVIDTGNRRVLLLDGDLKFNIVLLSNKIHRIENPNKLLFDESNGRLFVADIIDGTGTILVFDLSRLLP